MKTFKYRVVVAPDEDQWLAYCPALVKHGKDALEGILRAEAREAEPDPVPLYVLASHVVVSEVDIEVPENLAERTAIAASEEARRDGV